MGGEKQIITEIEVFKIVIFIILLAFVIWLFFGGGMYVITGVPF